MRPFIEPAVTRLPTPEVKLIRRTFAFLLGFSTAKINPAVVLSVLVDEVFEGQVKIKKGLLGRKNARSLRIAILPAFERAVVDFPFRLPEGFPLVKRLSLEKVDLLATGGKGTRRAKKKPKLFMAELTFGEGRFLEFLHLGKKFLLQALGHFCVSFPAEKVSQLVGIGLQIEQPGLVRVGKHELVALIEGGHPGPRRMADVNNPVIAQFLG